MLILHKTASIVSDSNEMNNELLQRITKQPDICHGRPTIRGMRYPVDVFLDLMASGMSEKEILDDYPDLEREDLLACLTYAARISHTKTVSQIVL